jgi:hypothetical protein
VRLKGNKKGLFALKRKRGIQPHAVESKGTIGIGSGAGIGIGVTELLLGHRDLQAHPFEVLPLQTQATPLQSERVQRGQSPQVGVKVVLIIGFQSLFLAVSLLKGKC